MIEVTVRVYGSLNDFLSPHRRQVTWPQVVDEHRSVKDLIEGLGVPHPEIDLILVNGTSVPFDHAVQRADRIAVFPAFKALDIQTLSRVRPPPLETTRFVADVHLGKLARHLRVMGLDTAYRADADDTALAGLAHREGRILLTRDVALLRRRAVAYGYFVRETHPHRQLVEILRRFCPARDPPVLPLPVLQRRAWRSRQSGDPDKASAANPPALSRLPGLPRMRPRVLEGLTLETADAGD